MIEAMIGIPGGGKSFYAVQRSLSYMSAGGAVFTNIRFSGVELCEGGEGLGKYRLSDDSPVRRVLRKHYNWEYVEGQYHYIDLETLDNTDLLSSVPRGSKTKPILLVLDEVNEWFDSLDSGVLKGKDAKAEKYRELFKFLRLSRHYHIDVLFLLQDFSTLNARLRGLCANVWRSTDMQKLRVPGIPFRFPFPWFLWQQYDKAGRVLVRSTTWPKEKHIFDCYDSFCEFGAVPLNGSQFNSDFGSAGRPKVKGGRMTNFDRVFVYGLLVALAVGLWLRGGGSAGAPAAPSVVYVTNSLPAVAAAPVSSVESSRRPSLVVSYEPYVYGCDGIDRRGQSLDWVLASGRKYRKGQKTPHGFVVDLSADYVRMVGDDGCEAFIYPLVIQGQFDGGGGDVGGGVRSSFDRGGGVTSRTFP